MKEHAHEGDLVGDENGSPSLCSLIRIWYESIEQKYQKANTLQGTKTI
jgi:hypothetical protein